MERVRTVPGLVIAGSASGVGKTSITVGLIGALCRRGLAVQPFKVGPDYIDPSYHTAVAGRPSRNLDSWMIGSTRLKELYRRATTTADIAIVEGVMGLFDGLEGRSETASTAEIAKLLNLPVVLVFDGSNMARSAAALVKGYAEYDPDLRIVGVIANRIASSEHHQMLFEAIDQLGLPLIGALPNRTDLKLPERHLGLVPVCEGRLPNGYYSQLIDHVEQYVDVDAIVDLAKIAGPIKPVVPSLFPREYRRPEISIAIAQDEAFCFYYQDNLDLLVAWGANLVPFSPLRDRDLPDGIHGIYLGGGFPELYASTLAANQAMKDSIRAANQKGLPVYGECGGYMYLCQSITDLNGNVSSGVGLVPGNVCMQGVRLSLGYREVRARRGMMLLDKGQIGRGHEFHQSALDRQFKTDDAVYQIVGPSDDSQEGYQRSNLVASYVHLHFASNPKIAPNFVAACAATVK